MAVRWIEDCGMADVWIEDDGSPPDAAVCVFPEKSPKRRPVSGMCPWHWVMRVPAIRRP